MPQPLWHLHVARVRRRRSSRGDVAGPQATVSEEQRGGLLCSPFHMGTSDRVPWPDGSFQAVLSSDVLEHVPTPLINATIGELTRLATDALFFKISIHRSTTSLLTLAPTDHSMRH